MLGHIAVSAFIIAVALGIVYGGPEESGIKVGDAWYAIPVLSAATAFGSAVCWLISLVWS